MDRVIIFAPNWLGDAVMALPAVADVRRGMPGARLAVAARRSVAPLFRLVPDVHEVVPLDDHAKPDVLQRPAGTAFDAALLLPNSFRIALLAYRAGIPERWGYRSDWRRPLLTKPVGRAPSGTHQVDAYQRLVRELGFPNGPSVPRLDVPAASRSAAADALQRAGWNGTDPFVALAPGAAYGGSKRWSPDSFGALARDLADEGVRPVLVGSAADAATGIAVETAAGGPRAVVNLIGRTDLATLTGLLATARALVSNDSGAMHLGAAIGVPVTAVFGPTDERLTGPRVDEAERARLAVLTHHVWCRPCGLRECPIHHGCMRGVTVGAVLDATRRLM